MSQCIHQSLCSFLVDISEKHMGANLVEMANNRFTDASSTTCLYSEVLHEGGEVLLTCQNNNLVLQGHKRAWQSVKFRHLCKLDVEVEVEYLSLKAFT